MVALLNVARLTLLHIHPPHTCRSPVLMTTSLRCSKMAEVTHNSFGYAIFPSSSNCFFFIIYLFIVISVYVLEYAWREGVRLAAFGL
jgi:hypothetical protein